MGRAVLQSCWPWMVLWVGSCAVLWLLARLNRAKLRWGRLRRLHRDQVGAAQSLSFVLTLPLFVLVMLLIVQISQVMIGTMVVHYAAYAAARSAIVWVPARLPGEPENWVPPYVLVDGEFELADPAEPVPEPSEGWSKYRVVDRSGMKYELIRRAAVMACVPISPSHTLVPLDNEGADAWPRLKAAYELLAPYSAWATRADGPVYNKLAYAVAHTDVEICFYHSKGEPPLVPHIEPYQHDPASPDPPEYVADGFSGREIGHQDAIEVTVRYDLKLLPGPARFFSAKTQSWTRSWESGNRQYSRQYYTYPLTASAMLNNEGDKSAVPYAH